MVSGDFFCYMRKHYSIDRLVDYSLEPVPDTIKIVNPDHRKLTSEVKKMRSVLSAKEGKFGSTLLTQEIGTKAYEKQKLKLCELTEEIQLLKELLNEKKRKLKETPRHLTMVNLPEEHRL